MLRVGLTGGIGSGKSTVAKVFEVLGVPVYYADLATRRLMNEDETLRRSIVTNFGAAAYKDGQLNRSYLASMVFADTKKLELLNAITHPPSIADSKRWMSRQQGHYAIKEAALIFESGSDQHLDFVIGVQAPEALRIQRIVSRDRVSEEQVRQRMLRQMDEEEKMKRCNAVIVNDEQESVIAQVIRLHESFVS